MAKRRLSQEGASPQEQIEDLGDELGRLERVLVQREIIGQATGILMIEHRVTPGGAGAMLARMADGEGRPIEDTAQRIVTERTPD